MPPQSSRKIAVVDYGMGNLKSVINALLFLGSHAIVSNKPEELAAADAIVLPGVGAFAEAMSNLKKLGLIDTLNEQVMHRKKPLLGICLGMQLLADTSEEFGTHEGLGWIPGQIRQLDVSGDLRLPHVGWNEVEVINDSPLFRGIDGELVYYFVHSYHFVCDEKYVAARCRYGINFTAAVQHENIMATQFHPEKSQDKGLKLLRNYLNFVEST